MTAPRKDCKVALVIFLQLSLLCLSESSNEDQYFRRMLAQTAPPILGKDPDLLFSELDKDGDGNIDPDEFNVLFGLVPSESPSIIPSDRPSTSPSFMPTRSTNPSRTPSNTPTESLFPSSFPSGRPSKSINPSSQPSTSMMPTDAPTHKPTFRPSDLPSKIPTGSPSKSMNPTPSPSKSSIPSDEPSRKPTNGPSDFPSKIPTGSPSKSMNPTPSPSKSSIPSDEPSRKPTYGPSDSPSKIPTGRPSKSMNPTHLPSKSSIPSDEPSRTPTSGPSDSPSKIPTESPSESMNPTPGSPNSPTGNALGSTLEPSLPSAGKPNVNPSTSVQPSHAPTSSSEPNAGLDFERIVALTNVTLQSVEGLLNEEAKVVFEEAALMLLIDRYPRMDRYDIDFLFVVVESQVFEDGRRLQDASRIGDLTVFLQVAAKIFPTTPSGFDFQSSMDAFFMAHDILLLDRLETVGISFNPETVQSETANSNPEKADKTDDASGSNRFSPTATVGIVMAMVAVLVTGVFVASRSMRQTPSEDYSLESPAGRLGAAPSYDDLDPEAIFMSLSELSKQDEGKSTYGNSGLSSITSYPTRHSAATGNSSHLAGLYVQQSSSFASTEDDTNALVDHRKRSGPKHTAGQDKRSRTSSQRLDNESDTLWDLPSSQMDDSTPDGDGHSTDQVVCAESKARQRKRTLEHRLRQSKQRSFSQPDRPYKVEEKMGDTFNEYTSVNGLISVSGDGSSMAANPNSRSNADAPTEKQEHTMRDSDGLENGIRIPVNKLFQSAPKSYDRMSDDESGMDVEVTKESFFEEKENQQEPTSSLGWLQKIGKRKNQKNGGKPLFGGLTLNFGRRKRGTESELGTRWQTLQETSYCSDEAGDEPETILLDHAGYNQIGFSPSSTSAERRNRPPLLDLRELGADDNSMIETPVETPLTEFPIPSSAGGPAEPDGYALTSRNKRKVEKHLQQRSNSQPESSDDCRQGDPPTAAEHRQTMLAARRRGLRSGMKSKENVPRKRLHRVSFHQEATTIPVEQKFGTVEGSI